MLRFDDPLPIQPQRILVAGVSGVGKTTLARQIGSTLGIGHTEIDALFHGPGWTPRPEFLDDVHALIAQDSWVTEWQYSPARPLLAARADLVVWLDFPFFTVTLPRVIRRTIRRRTRRDELWNGNVEPPFHTFFTDPEHIVRWAWSTRNNYRERMPTLQSAPPDLTIVRLRSPRQADAWLTNALSRSAQGSSSG